MFKRGLTSALLVAVSATALSLTGCERKERVLDIKTPGADVKVDRNLDTGGVEVKTERK
jgi:hypothetical protein